MHEHVKVGVIEDEWLGPVVGLAVKGQQVGLSVQQARELARDLGYLAHELDNPPIQRRKDTVPQEVHDANMYRLHRLAYRHGLPPHMERPGDEKDAA